MPPRLDTLPKGHELPPSTFELSSEWVREYVAAVEDEAVGALDGGLVPPMAVAALAVRSLLDGAELPPGAIHLGQEMASLRPVRVGERLAVSARIASRGERQGWVLMGIDLNVEGEDRGPVMKGRATLTMPASPDREALT
jgi:acyl dehydratase